MALNNDGLEPGQPVDFETIQRIERQRRAKHATADEAPKRRRKAKIQQPDDGSTSAEEASTH